jgi:DNA-binding response OmpR family regulator
MNRARKLAVAEDSDNDFLLLEFALEQTPQMQLVHRSRHGREVMEYLSGAGSYADRERHSWPDVLLLDLHMPICDGFGVLRWLSEQTFPTKPRVVILSSSSRNTDRELAFSLGADEYHVKPNDHDQLVAIIRGISGTAMTTEQ